MEQEEIVKKYMYTNGQMVKVKDVPVGTMECHILFTEPMKDFIGQIIEVRPEFVDNGINFYNYEGWTFSENWLELVNETEQEEIKPMDIKLSETPTKEELEEMIKKVDVNTMLKIIKARMKANGYRSEIISAITPGKINKYLTAWAKAKYRFYKLFGNNLYLKKEIEREKNSDWYQEKRNDIKIKFPLYSFILDKINILDIVNNKMTLNSSRTFYDDSKATTGMKFTKLMALYGNNDLNMEISKIYQDKAIEEIIISIDPIDYLTVSINKSWRSCHNFINGEYRNAGLSLMLDKTSMVAYTSGSNTEYTFEGITFKANNKSWRQMIYLSEKNSEIVCSLNYPYRSKELSKAVRLLLEDKLSEYLKIPNKWKVKEACDFSVDYINMYNDIGREGCKYIINKYDNKRMATLKTGVKIPAINNSKYFIEESEEDLWT